MWLLSAVLPIRLEILDQAGQSLFHVPGSLQQLDEQYAVVIVDAPLSAARLHWGSPVRFEVEDGLRRYEITGVIVTRQAGTGGDEGDREAEGTSWELRIRIWECQLNVQRRALPRRKLKFSVRFRSLCSGDNDGNDVGMEDEVASGWCVDIGPGGIRMRTQRLETVPDRMSLRFELPISGGPDRWANCHEFCLSGRVIRAEVRGRSTHNMEIALRFERLSVQDGLVLRNLLS